MCGMRYLKLCTPEPRVQVSYDPVISIISHQPMLLGLLENFC